MVLLRRSGATAWPSGPTDIEVAWNFVEQNGDDTFFLANSYRIRFGTVSGGPYEWTLDLRTENPTDRGATRYTIQNIASGTYYGVVEAIDAHGNIGTASSQWTCVVDGTPPATGWPPTFGSTVTNPSSFPLDPANDTLYHFTADATIASGNVFDMSTSRAKVGIKIDPGVVVKFATTGQGVFFDSNEFACTELYLFGGGELRHGSTAGAGYNPTAGQNVIAFYMQNSATTLVCRDVTVDMGITNRATFADNNITFWTGLGFISHLFRDCTLTIRGAGTTLTAFSGNWDVLASVARNCTVNILDRGSLGPYMGGLQSFREVSGCTFTLSEIDGELGCQVVTGRYIHGNTFSLTNVGRVRVWLCEGVTPGGGWFLGNSFSGSGNSPRIVRTRSACSNIAIGFNTINFTSPRVANGSGIVGLLNTGSGLGSTNVTNIEAVAAGSGAGKSIFRRSSGSWITDGYYVGLSVITRGFDTSANNGHWIVSALTSATDLEVTDVGDTIVNEAAEVGQTLHYTVDPYDVYLYNNEVVGCSPCFSAPWTHFRHYSWNNSYAGVDHGAGSTDWEYPIYIESGGDPNSDVVEKVYFIDDTITAGPSGTGVLFVDPTNDHKVYDVQFVGSTPTITNNYSSEVVAGTNLFTPGTTPPSSAVKPLQGKTPKAPTGVTATEVA